MLDFSLDMPYSLHRAHLLQVTKGQRTEAKTETRPLQVRGQSHNFLSSSYLWSHRECL